MSTAILERPTAASTIDIVGDDELYEIINGIRVRTPAMGVFAVWIASDLLFHLASFAKTKSLGRAIAEALFHLPDPIHRDRRPDVAFVSFERWAKNRPIPPTDNAWDVVPNLAIEVISPNDKADDVEEKIAEYFQAGVQLVWVVYPTKAKIHVYHSLTQISVLTRNDTLDGGTVVPGFHLPLAELFPDLTEPATANGTSVAN